MDQHDKAKEKLETDFDFLRILKQLREHSIQLRALLDLPQRRLTKRLAQRDIQCSESDSSCDENEFVQTAGPDELPTDVSAKVAQYRYLDDIMAEYDKLENRRLLKQYLKLAAGGQEKVKT
jgi:hypothetical protein